MGITYTEGVANRGMSLQRFVDVTSANAARILGMYPRKGGHRAGKRRRHHPDRPQPGSEAAPNRPPRDRLQRVGRVGAEGVAGYDGPAGKGDR